MTILYTRNPFLSNDAVSHRGRQHQMHRLGQAPGAQVADGGVVALAGELVHGVGYLGLLAAFQGVVVGIGLAPPLLVQDTR
jgi:hypothetical protein